MELSQLARMWAIWWFAHFIPLDEDIPWTLWKICTTSLKDCCMCERAIMVQRFPPTLNEKRAHFPVFKKLPGTLRQDSQIQLCSQGRSHIQLPVIEWCTCMCKPTLRSERFNCDSYLLLFAWGRFSFKDAGVHGFNVLDQEAKKFLVEAKYKLWEWRQEKQSCQNS